MATRPNWLPTRSLSMTVTLCASLAALLLAGNPIAAGVARGAGPSAAASLSEQHAVSRLASGPRRLSSHGSNALPTGLYPALIAAEERTGNPLYRMETNRGGDAHQATPTTLRVPDLAPGTHLRPPAESGTAAIYGRNPAQKLLLGFGRLGVTVSPATFPAAGAVRLRMLRIGYGAHLRPVRGAQPVSSGTRVSYDRGALREWYVNGPAGLEQGFTLASRPAGAHAGGRALTLAVGVSGASSMRLVHGAVVLGMGGGDAINRRRGDAINRRGGDAINRRRGDAINRRGGDAINRRGGDAINRRLYIRYANLYAHDATGRQLPAHLALSQSSQGMRIRLVIDDRGAAYPLTIDPTLGTQATLTDPANTAGDNFGVSVALSGDGSTALVGAYGTNSYTGAAYIFRKPSGGWSSTGSATATLSVSALGSYSDFGYSVALNRDPGNADDGTVAVIGAFSAGTGGVAYVFKVSNSSSWASTSSPTATLSNPDTTAGNSDEFGYSVAVSANGGTALVGAPSTNFSAGAAYVFSATGSLTATLSNPDSTAGNADEFGYAVALSGDAGTALVGALYANSGAGKAYVFTKPSTGWVSTSSAAALTAPGGAQNDNFGYAVALSGDGGTALVGAPFTDSGAGKAYVFTKPGTSWGSTSNAAALSDPANNAGGSDNFGTSVALSGDGTVALVGAPYTNNYAGSAYVFIKPGGGWTGTGSPYATLSSPNSGDFGISVALSGDGNTTLAGAYGTNSGAGTAYVQPLSTSPTLAVLGRVSTRRIAQRIVFRWRAAFDRQVLGFNVLAGRAGHLRRLNRRLITAHRGLRGHTDFVFSAHLPHARWFAIEAITTHGSIEYGPYRVGG